MVDMLKSSRDEDQRKRDEAQLYSMQQQIDELRRQLKENLARQQWFEELYRQGEGKVSQLQMAQDRLVQDVAQSLHARQIDEGRVKAQLSDLAQRVESPDKQLREIRAQISELSNALKNDREGDGEDRRVIEDLQRQIREINASLSLVSDGQRQLRALIQELDSAIGEVRQEAVHIAELQRGEEQRLRRQGIELQELFETLRQQFADVAAKSQRVDDVRRQLTERIEAIEELVSAGKDQSTDLFETLERLESLSTEQFLTLQERLEAARGQIEAQIGEMRQVNDQRMDRYMGRFVGVDERIRSVEQTIAEFPSRFEALERSDEKIGTEADAIEEWLVMRQVEALENVLDQVRKRRTERATTLKIPPPVVPSVTPGSVYNPEGLVKSVRDARPPARKTQDHTGEDGPKE